MKKYFFILFAVGFTASLKAQSKNSGFNKYILVIHGGAGTILKSTMTPEK